jgi:L-aminopeptidase/D-esterase-like protein
MVRARDLGVPFDGQPGPLNAITDVAGVEVGHTTIIAGDGDLQPGVGPIRTGVTVILPQGKRYAPVMGAWYSLNGSGELTGTAWLEESGFLESGIAITNTLSVGTVHTSLITWAQMNIPFDFSELRDVFWFLPVVGETNDMFLNDITGFHVQPEHVFAALDGATGGPVAEGNVGGGTGMVCHEFKGGIGTASRVLDIDGRTYTLGILVQANYGVRDALTIAGVPVGRAIPDLMPDVSGFLPEPGSGSIVIIVATDAPLLPHQLKRLAKRIPMGLARTGGTGGNGSGDLFLAFSTANGNPADHDGVLRADYLPNGRVTPLFEAAIQATEEAIVNALVAAQTMTGVNGNTVYALPHDRLVDVLQAYNRLAVP